MRNAAKHEIPLKWIGSSLKDLMALPRRIRREFGFALSIAQIGGKHPSVKALKGFGGASVLEVLEQDANGTYRAVYTLKFVDAIYVLHCFQKKSKQGISTPKPDLDIIRARLKIVGSQYKE